MSLIKSKSKHAFEENVKTEIEAGKPMKQSLAIAYNTKKQASKKKYAKGGEVKKKYDQGEIKGVHPAIADRTPQGAKDSPSGRHDTKQPSLAGIMTERSKKGSNEAVKVIAGEQAKTLHKKALKELKEMPKPKLAEGGKIQTTPLKQGKLMGNPMFSVKSRLDEAEEHLMSMKPEKHQGMSEDKAPSEKEYMSEQEDMYAQGGEVSIKKEMYDQPEPEAEEERHASLAAAIMAKRKKESQVSGSKDDDHAAMYAEGGEVDIEENMTEEPNMYYKRNREALKEPMMGERISQMHQPKYSNEIDDPREEHEENDLDMISALRRKVAKKRYFGE